MKSVNDHTDSQYGPIILVGASVSPVEDTHPERLVGKIGEVHQAFGNWVRVKFPKDRRLYSYRVSTVLQQTNIKAAS